jgi:hypothetical protein
VTLGRVSGAPSRAAKAGNNPVVALELLATGAGSGAGVLGPARPCPAGPFLALLTAHGFPWGIREQ